MMSLGTSLAEARRKAGLTQERVAEKLGVSRQTISKWENNQALPDAYNLKILSKVLGASVDEIIDPDKEVKRQDDNQIIGAIDHVVSLGKRHWQKIGYYFIYTGLALLAMGILVSVMSNSLFGSFDLIGDDFMESPLSMFDIIRNFMLIVALVLLVAGIVLVIYDRHKQKTYKQKTGSR